MRIGIIEDDTLLRKALDKEIFFQVELPEKIICERSLQKKWI